MGSLYFLPYSANYPSTGSNYKQKLADTWTKYKENFIDAYVTSHPGSYLVHDPIMSDVEATAGFDETEGASSEAQGYGLLLALYNNDQAYFDNILTAAYAKMHNKDGKGLFAAIVDKSGNVSSDVSSATNGDIFITLALVFADILVKHGYWSDTSNAYGSKAQNLIDNIYANDVESGQYLLPGSSWAGKNAAKPSSFFTAALKTFKYYQTTFHNWDAVVDQCYATLQLSQGYSKGLSPDLIDITTGGISQYGTTGPANNGADMWYDAIKTPWMASLDATWFNDPRAEDYCKNGMNFLTGRYGSEASAASNSILYKMDGTALTNEDGAFHSEITAGMWTTGAMGSKLAASKSAFNTEFEDNFSQNALLANGGYWGNWSGSGTYYDKQSLASFAAFVMAGNFVNVYKDLETAPDTTPPSDPVVTDDGTYTILPSQLHAAWSASVDEESGITEYQYSISTDPTDPEAGKIVDWTSAGTNTEVAATGLSLTDGTTYYFHVKALNGVGLASNIVHSDGIIVDTSAPSDPFITETEYNASLSQLHVVWDPSSDKESGITEYRYAISTDPTDPDNGNILLWTSAGTNTEVTLEGLALSIDKTYYFHIMAQNGAGQWSNIGHSSGIVVSAPTIISGPSRTTKAFVCSPNPFQSDIRIKYQLGSASEVTINIYDGFGRLVSTLAPGKQSAGDKEAVWDGSNAASGTYYIQIRAGGNTFSTAKVVKQ